MMWNACSWAFGAEALFHPWGPQQPRVRAPDPGRSGAARLVALVRFLPPHLSNPRGARRTPLTVDKPFCSTSRDGRARCARPLADGTGTAAGEPGEGVAEGGTLVSLKTLLILAVVALVAWKIYLVFGQFFLNYPRPTL